MNVLENRYLIKVEKIPAAPENWMGIMDFIEKMELPSVPMVS